LTHPELLTSTVPQPKGVPSKHWLKVASVGLLLLVMLGLIFSYEDEPLKAGDDLARMAASTLSTVERSHVDQNHQIIEEAFKASGLPTDWSALQNAADSGVSKPATGNAFTDSALKFQDQGIMKSAGSRLSPLPLGLLPQASFNGTPAIPPVPPVLDPERANNAVSVAQEALVMNSKMVIVDFDDLSRQKESSSKSMGHLNDLNTIGTGSLAGRAGSSGSALAEPVQSGLKRVNSSSAMKVSSLPTPLESSPIWEALALAQAQSLGKDQERSTPVSVRSADGEFLRELKNNPLFKPGLKPNRLESERSILEGTIIPAVLTRDINSDLPGTITAQVTQTVYDSITSKTPLICKGAKLIGRYSNDIRTGQSRLLFAFTRLILLNGESFNLTGFDGADALGQAGVGGQVDNHFLKIYGSSLAIGVLSDQITRQQAIPQGAFSTGSATGQIMVQTTREILQRGRDQAPTITVARGSLINVEVRQDLVFMGGDKVLCT